MSMWEAWSAWRQLENHDIIPPNYRAYQRRLTILALKICTGGNNNQLASYINNNSVRKKDGSEFPPNTLHHNCMRNHEVSKVEWVSQN